MRAVWVLTVIFFSLSCLGAQANEVVIKDAPIQFYLVEILGPSQNQMNNPSSQVKDLFINQLRLAGFHVLYDLEPPFVSKEMIHYGVSQPTGFELSGIGYVHCSLNEDDTLHYESDSGQDVSLKTDPKSILWMFEKKKALEMADQAGAKYAFVIEISTRMVYQSNSPRPIYNVDLSADLYQADKGDRLLHYDESMVKLASTAQRAVLGASHFLAPQLMEDILEGQKNNASDKLF